MKYGENELTKKLVLAGIKEERALAYAQILLHHKVHDDEALLGLTHQSLKDIGITSVGHRLRVLSLKEKLKVKKLADATVGSSVDDRLKSWQQYIDFLVENNVTRCLICSRKDGTLWASSWGVYSTPITKEERAALCELFNKPEEQRAQTDLTLDKVIYQARYLEKSPNGCLCVEGRSLQASSEKWVCYGSRDALVFGFYAGDVTLRIVEHIAGHLYDYGY
ncbi:Mapkkk cascade protein kinase regulator ste50 [Balamuthia mandrillaris]